jgi:hypothetical protein
MSDDIADLIATARAVALAVNDDEVTSEQQAKLAQVDLLLAASLDRLLARLDALEARQLAPVVPIARGPLDYQPDAAITLATVVPEDADREWWRSRIVPLGEDES